jgi:hypothetical protein
MKPKHLPLFYAALVTGLVGVWLFAFTLYWLGQESDEVHGANIGAGLVGLLSWLFGLASLLLGVLSFCIKPKE